jgi:hypothetical protein
MPQPVTRFETRAAALFCSNPAASYCCFVRGPLLIACEGRVDAARAASWPTLRSAAQVQCGDANLRLPVHQSGERKPNLMYPGAGSR